VRLCDQATRDYRDYLDRRAADGEAAAAAHPAIAAAERLQADDDLCDSLKIMVVGSLLADEICARLALEPAELAAWEQLFFDVRPMYDSPPWIAAHVINPERRRGRSQLAAKLKLAANGPDAARAVLNGSARLPLDDAGRLFDQRLRLHAKFDEAIESPLDPMSFLKLYVRLEIQRERIEQEKFKLAERSKQADRRYELELLRVEHAQQREQQRREARAARQCSALGARSGAADRRALAERIARCPLSQLVWAPPAEPPISQLAVAANAAFAVAGVEDQPAGRPRRTSPVVAAFSEETALPVEGLACGL
jgi:hypothetical protein